MEYIVYILLSRTAHSKGIGIISTFEIAEKMIA